MIKIGLTGGIGSGKTYVASIFMQLGVLVYDSDKATKDLYLTNQELKGELISNFGEETYFSNGQLNKKYLGNIVFGDKKKLELINRIVHPYVRMDFENWVKKSDEQKYVVKEAAILIESGAYKQLDKIIVVSAPIDVRINRVRKRDNVSAEEVRKRMNKQLQPEKLLEFADFIIENDGKRPLQEQVESIHFQLLQE